MDDLGVGVDRGDVHREDVNQDVVTNLDDVDRGDVDQDYVDLVDVPEDTDGLHELTGEVDKKGESSR